MPVGICERLNSGAGVIPVLRLGAPLLCHFIMALGDQWSLDFRVIFRTRLSRGCLAFFLKFSGPGEFAVAVKETEVGGCFLCGYPSSILSHAVLDTVYQCALNGIQKMLKVSCLYHLVSFARQTYLSISQKAQLRLLSHLSLP